MATKNKTGKPPVEAAALPEHVQQPTDLVQNMATLNDLIGSAHHSTAYEVLALVRAAENLADCHRVLSEIGLRAEIDPAFETELKSACPSFRNPQMVGRNGSAPLEVIQDLLRAAGNLLDGVSDNLNDAEQQSRRNWRLAKGDAS